MEEQKGDTVVHRFYEAFKVRDGKTMAESYDKDAVFHDPVFPNLEGEDPGNMWKMLMGRPSQGFEICDVKIKELGSASEEDPNFEVVKTKGKDGKFSCSNDLFSPCVKGKIYEAFWTAKYVFQGNPVVNNVRSVIRVHNEKFVEQNDEVIFFYLLPAL